jgi:hypothetical protein
MTLLRSVCVVLICAVWCGCGKRRVAVDRETIRIIDTLASREIFALRPVLDSVCQVKMDSIVSVKRDSILQERRKEILKLIGK